MWVLEVLHGDVRLILAPDACGTEVNGEEGNEDKGDGEERHENDGGEEHDQRLDENKVGERRVRVVVAELGDV